MSHHRHFENHRPLTEQYDDDESASSMMKTVIEEGNWSTRTISIVDEKKKKKTFSSDQNDEAKYSSPFLLSNKVLKANELQPQRILQAVDSKEAEKDNIRLQQSNFVGMLLDIAQK